MARSPSESTLISTNANPLACPVSRSVTMLTRSTAPYDSNIERSESSVVPKLRFPTKIFFKLFVSLLNLQRLIGQDRTKAVRPDNVGKCVNRQNCQIPIQDTTESDQVLFIIILPFSGGYGQRAGSSSRDAKIAPVCGIAGIVHSRIGPGEMTQALSRMSEALKHRGPDDSAECLYPSMNAGLASRRLALVDLSTGRQPIGNEDESIHLVANGEIYNHRELRKELEQRGHRFRTCTDIEVVLHLYEEYGADCFGRLNGMFGLAILDCRRRLLILARDRSGMKPLYYASTRSGFIFASEPGALLASGLTERAPDWDGLDIYLAIGYTPAPRTCFREIRKLKAGHYSCVGEMGVHDEAYWNLRYSDAMPRRDEQEYAEELERLLRQAVRSHIDADVPVGAFVSGGWDSSLVGLMASQSSPSRLKTFSIVFPEHPEIDEGRYSRELARHASSEHHEIEFRGSNIPDVLPSAMRHMGEPCLASPCVLFYMLSSLAASSVKAVIGGEGSDEQFAGYECTGENRSLLLVAPGLAAQAVSEAVAEYETSAMGPFMASAGGQG